jgi:class 3 adenylate cyclase
LAGTTDIDGILRDAAWRNERIINRFRIGYCLLMGVPSTLFNLAEGHGIPTGNWGFLIWLGIALVTEVVLRRRYHPVLAFGLATADIVLQETSLYLFALTLSPESKEFLPALYGIGVSGLVMAAMSMARFSVPIAAWSVALSWGLFVFLVTRVRPFDVGFIFEGILYLFFLGLLWLNARRFRELPLRMRERDAFARFLPAPAIERIVKNPASLNLGGEEQDATVLFSDLRGFTTLSAGLPPATVVRLLNEYFKEMVEEVFQHQGTLDKFIGDGLCAVFSPPLSAQEQAQSALRCALGMVKRLEKLNAGWAARGEPQLKLGVGIHCGKLVAGNIGSPMRMEYTHIGDAVNTCSRIEGMTKELGAPVLASQAVVQRAGAMGDIATRELPAVTVRGKSDSIVLCAVTSS